MSGRAATGPRRDRRRFWATVLALAALWLAAIPAAAQERPGAGPEVADPVLAPPRQPAPGARPQAPNQGAATPVALVADLVRVAPGEVLVAEGNVEVFARGARLSASRLTYDRAADQLTIDGPITLQDAGGVLVVADAAELDSELREGLLLGARLILDERLQIAGAELARRQGRFNDLRRVVASSCEVCRPGQSPLWELRARRVIHDEAAQQIYFYGAQFRIKGVPVAYLPTLRVTDPRNTRANGFLPPSVRTTDGLGPGLKLPYFITLGDHADILLTPYLATDFTRTLEGRYRQAFGSGAIVFDGAISRDDLAPGELRAYLFGEGRFDLPRDFELRFDIESVTDDAYLQDYDYSQADRLDSAIGVLRSDGSERIAAELIHYRSLREDEDNDTLEALVGDVRYDHRLAPRMLGGWLDLGVVVKGAARPSDRDIVGRDTSQIRGRAAWSRHWTGPAGLRFGAEAVGLADVKQIREDSRFDRLQGAVTPIGAVELAWPLSKPGAPGISYLLEPVVQLVAAPERGFDSPNDDSTRSAFDSGNLLALNRFPGLDRIEEGARSNLALSWRRVAPAGLSLGATLGQVIRAQDRDQFSPGTGLSGVRSDWLTQVDFDLARWLTFRSLSLLDSGFEPTLNETRLAWRGERLAFASSYVFQDAESSLDIDRDLSEVALDARFEVSRAWSGELDLRRDLTRDRVNRAGLGVSYGNECVRVDLSVLRRFRSTGDTEPETSYGLSVTLAGFGNQEGDRARRSRCRS